MTIVFIDLDGTLLTRKGSEVYFALYLLRHGILGPKQIASYFRFFLRWFPYFGGSVLKKNKAYLTGLVESDIIAIAERFAKGQLKHHIRVSLFKELESHRRRGDHLVLLTGSLDILATPLAEIFNIPEVYATRCQTREGRFTDRPPSSHPSGEEKRRIADQVAKNHRSRLSNCIAYADSMDDLPLLSAVSRPVSVDPGSGLRRIARSKNWEIL